MGPLAASRSSCHKAIGLSWKADGWMDGWTGKREVYLRGVAVWVGPLVQPRRSLAQTDQRSVGKSDAIRSDARSAPGVRLRGTIRLVGPRRTKWDRLWSINY